MARLAQMKGPVLADKDLRFVGEALKTLEGVNIGFRVRNGDGELTWYTSLLRVMEAKRILFDPLGIEVPRKDIEDMKTTDFKISGNQQDLISIDSWVSLLISKIN